MYDRGEDNGSLFKMLNLFIPGKSAKFDSANVKQLATEGNTTQWLSFELSEIHRPYDRKATKCQMG